MILRIKIRNLILLIYIAFFKILIITSHLYYSLASTYCFALMQLALLVLGQRHTTFA